LRRAFASRYPEDKLRKQKLLFLLCVLVGCEANNGQHGHDLAGVGGLDLSSLISDGGSTDSSTLDLSTPVVCSDSCLQPGGVTWGCVTRFVYGTNWAWRDFAADFGGISAWGQKGVSADAATVGSSLAAMKAAGASVIRWWMFPRFLSDSIQWGSDGAPSGIGGTLVADIDKALELAQENDVYIMLTPFSFDNFKPTATEAGIYSRSIKPMVTDATLRQELLQNLMVPVAQAVEASPYKQRMIAWDMINEPEWAMTGSDLYGGADFTPSNGCDPVTHQEMETFLNELAVVLRSNNRALRTVGSAAIKWAPAWTHINMEFYQLHYYDWIYEWFPYQSVTLASVGLTDKPVVMGEFPINGLSAVNTSPARTAFEFVSDLWSDGYAGALAWAYNDSAFPWDPAALTPFHEQHSCETTY
jgi:hypothetical protein